MTDPVPDKLTDEERAALAAALVEAEELGGSQAYGFNVHVWLAARDFYAARGSVSLPNADGLERDSEILGYVTETLDEYGAPTEDSEGRELSANGRLVDYLHGRSSRAAELERERDAAVASANARKGRKREWKRRKGAEARAEAAEAALDALRSGRVSLEQTDQSAPSHPALAAAPSPEGDEEAVER